MKLILFDFDGVLVDSFEAAYEAALHIFPDLEREGMRKMFEGNIHEAHEELQNNSGKAGNTIGEFFTYYVPKVPSLPIVEGMREVVEELAKEFRMVVVSSTISSPIHAWLEKHEMERSFEEILGADVHASKAVKIQRVLEGYKVSPKDCVFITDTLGDMREAAQCEVQAIGVTWGFHEKERLQKGKFAALVESPGELPGAIRAYFGQAY